MRFQAPPAPHLLPASPNARLGTSITSGILLSESLRCLPAGAAPRRPRQTGARLPPVTTVCTQGPSLGPPGRRVPPKTVFRSISVERLPAVERRVGSVHGYHTRRAGFIADVADAVAAHAHGGAVGDIQGSAAAAANVHPRSVAPGRARPVDGRRACIAGVKAERDYFRKKVTIGVDRERAITQAADPRICVTLPTGRLAGTVRPGCDNRRQRTSLLANKANRYRVRSVES